MNISVLSDLTAAMRFYALKRIGEIEMVEENELIDESDHKYYSMIPHIFDDLPLTNSAVRLYLHIKRRAGETSDGKCWESTENIANHLRMSKSTVCRARGELAKHRLIRVNKIERGHGEFAYCEVKITDVWKFNNDFYSLRSKEDREAWLQKYSDEFNKRPKK